MPMLSRTNIIKKSIQALHGCSPSTSSPIFQLQQTCLSHASIERMFTIYQGPAKAAVSMNYLTPHTTVDTIIPVAAIDFYKGEACKDINPSRMTVIYIVPPGQKQRAMSIVEEDNSHTVNRFKSHIYPTSHGDMRKLFGKKFRVSEGSCIMERTAYDFGSIYDLFTSPGISCFDTTVNLIKSDRRRVDAEVKIRGDKGLATYRYQKLPFLLDDMFDDYDTAVSEGSIAFRAYALRSVVRYEKMLKQQ